MSDRSKLEKASWVASIVAAAVSVFLFVKPDGLREQQSVSQAPLMGSEIQLASSNSNNSEKVETAKAEGCPAEAGGFSIALESAQKMYSTTKRDGMYLDIARRALCIGDQEVYESTAEKIYTTKIRDQAYLEGVDHYLRASSRDQALSIAQKIYQTALRDEAFARIASRTIAQ